MMRTKTKISACVGLALVVPPMFSGTAEASSAPVPNPTSGPATSGGAALSSRIEGDRVLYTASSSGVGVAAATNIGAFGGGSGWSAHFENVIWSTTNNTKVGVYFAKMERTGGSGDYGADAHVALMRGGYDGDMVFSVENHACANSAQKNATAQTCGSDGFSTSRGQVWTQAAGGGFDQGYNGSQEWGINGETDIVWRTP